MNGVDRKGDAFDRDVQRSLGMMIRKNCETIVSEPIGDRLGRLLTELDRREAEDDERRAS